MKKAKNTSQQEKELEEVVVEDDLSQDNEVQENVAQEEVNQESQENEEIENLNNRLLRLQADYLNYKNRAEKEKTQTYNNAVADVINCLLPVVDNLERALEAEASKENSLKEGIEMIYSQMMGILDKKGLKEIEALKKPFDHNFHYGVAFESDSEEEDGTIIEVFQKGYTVNDKVIRPSMVKICKK